MANRNASRKRETQGTGRRAGARRRVPGSSTAAQGRGQHRARPQALTSTSGTSASRLDPHARDGRREGAGAAALGHHASVPAAGRARRLPARAQGPQAAHEGAAALHQRGEVAGRERPGRRGEPRAERDRHHLLPRRPAGIHRGRPRQPGGRQRSRRRSEERLDRGKRRRGVLFGDEMPRINRRARRPWAPGRASR